MSCKWKLSLKELKKVSYVAAPMVAVTVLQYLMQVGSVMMVGHLYELSLSGISSASSFTSVTGFSLLVSGSSKYIKDKLFKLHLTWCYDCQTVRISWCIGSSMRASLRSRAISKAEDLHLQCHHFLDFGLSPYILCMDVHRQASYPYRPRPFNLHVARKYSICLIPNLFSYAILQALIRCFQTQSLILPMLFSSFASLCFHIPLCWALVFKAEMGIIGAALAISLSYWLNVILIHEQQLSSNIQEKNIKLPAMVDNSLSSLMLLRDMIRVLLFCSASGVARGSGWQKFGAYVNLGACYLVGTPVAAVLAFVLHLRARSCVQASLLALRTIFTNWKEYGFNPNNFLLQFDLLLR
ncbi:hypothetical protein D5086_033547 [Populus alba]|uniref:Uncharacterized protein n=1 Tax=Populus alba TaxID=43335 RepID=A0ACC4AH38_POPAL